MKKYFKISNLLLMVLFISTSVCKVQAQTQALPEMKFPELEYKPSITTGWAGQYVYELHFDGKSSLKSAKGEVPYYRVKSDRVHTGYVEFPMEVKGAIRSNQPDKNNKERYESWIRSGSSQSWSKVVDTIKTIVFTGSMGDVVNSGTRETNYARNSNGNWVEGWMEGCDMQIDYTTGKYSFDLPVAAFEIDEEVWGVETNFKPETKKPFQRKETTRLGSRNVTYLQFDMPEYIVDTFQKDQKEIVIRKRIPVLLQQTTTQGVKDIKLPVVKGFMDFYLVLRKAPFTDSDTKNKSAAAPDKPAAIEPGKEKTTEAVTVPESPAKKKTVISVLKKVKNVIKNN